MSKTPARTRQAAATDPKAPRQALSRKRKLTPAPLFDGSRASREELAAHRDRVSAWLAVYAPPVPEPEVSEPGTRQLPFEFHRDVEPLYVVPWVERELGKYHTRGELGVLRQPSNGVLKRVGLACRSTQRWDRANWLWSIEDDGEHAASYVRLLCDAWAAELKQPDWDRRGIDELLDEVQETFLREHTQVIEECDGFKLCKQPVFRESLPWAVRVGWHSADENFATEAEARDYFRAVLKLSPAGSATDTSSGAS